MLRTFSAKVTGCEKVSNGYAVTLDATAFYPEGGGQACDLGKLGDANVLDVQERGEDVVHLCDAPLEMGAIVQGEIDWERRFDLMQQHTGEHILSGVLHKLYGCQNVGFHVGADRMEVDFDGMLTQEQVDEAVRLANRAVWQDMPVKCWTPDPQELEKTVYRTKRPLPWPVRIVQVGDVDSCACCGVHTKSTGQVGLIAVFSCVKFHQGIRLEMACGERALRYVNQIFNENRAVSRLLSAKMPETAAAVEKLKESLAAEKYKAAALQTRLFDAIGESYRGVCRPVHFEEHLTGGAIRELAEKIAQVCQEAVVCAGSDEAGYNVCIIAQDAAHIGKGLSAALGGRGGGKGGVFQGNVKASKQALLQFLRQDS